MSIRSGSIPDLSYRRPTIVPPRGPRAPAVPPNGPIATLPAHQPVPPSVASQTTSTLPSPPDKPAQPSMASQDELVALSQYKLAVAMQSVNENGVDDHTDLTITCGGDTHKVHKVVLCAQSPYFRAACKPGTFQEGQSSTIDLPDRKGSNAEVASGNSRSAVRCMINTFYGRPNFTTNDPLNILEYIISADKYDFEVMRQIYISKFKSVPFDGVGDWHTCVEKFYPSVRHLEGVKWRLHQLAVDYHLEYLSTSDGQALLDIVPDFAIDFMHSLHKYGKVSYDKTGPAVVEGVDLPRPSGNSSNLY